MFKNPDWLPTKKYPFEKFNKIPQAAFDEINQKLKKKVSTNPEITILIAAWNEETNILRCISTLSDQLTTRPFEIVVINNNSSDYTQQTLDKLHVHSFFQEIQGPGPARQMGIENAKGKYVLLADADCYYPRYWVDEMMAVLTQPGIVCVYGRYSFISEEGFSRWQLVLLEKMKDAIAEFRHINRPYLNTYGISMGFVKSLALKIGFVMKNVRGEDGRMSYALMRYGKIKQVKSSKARVWTAARTLKRDGSLFKVIAIRIIKELKGMAFNLSKKAPKEIENLD